MRLGVLVSGKGTNLQAILDAIECGELDATVAYVACNHRGVQAMERARKAGVPVGLYVQQEYGTREAQQRAIAGKLVGEGVEQVVLAGWDRVLTREFVAAFEGRIINVHPSLLPAFSGGLHAIAEALRYGVKITGCTVHFVTNDLDAGPIIAQAAVAVLQDDTEETLAERIHEEEHRILVQSLKALAAGKLKINGRDVSCEP